MTAETLALVWSAVIVLGVVMYVILDGFDLGLGILFPFAPNDQARDTMMTSVAPVWDGNETWLILGGAALFGAFPVAYSVLLPALYIPVMLFLFALVFRGVAFEFRHKAFRSRFMWSMSFNVGSTVAAFFQGLILGAFIQGFQVENYEYTGGLFDWLTPFSVLTGFALVAGYALLGATWMIMKAEGPLQEWCYGVAKKLLFAVAMAILAVSVWTPLIDSDIAARWFTWPNLLWLSPVPIVTAGVVLALWTSLQRKAERTPFLYSIGLFLLSFIGLWVSLWPYVVPRAVTIYDASSGVASQVFLLVGVLILLPLILGYTAYAYWVFRGKTKVDEGYH
ncbi:cytochrome d ubiquinol oxidase subunit II [Telmatospirillum sp. J64-1]|uniref:cytochrome d ubiquinol oxidase subunit II n=1 Tax=Telmatospirillum sp. J64-1 TaxID=2502183 RepID=UPI00115D7D5E|nr:cytochrome d ubiquinol oxidase subunit II [Telmatospirillum sp. J64-1]